MKQNPLPNIKRRLIKGNWIIDREKNIKKWIQFTVKNNQQLEYMQNKLKLGYNWFDFLARFSLRLETK